MVSDVGPANNGLNDVGGMTACFEGASRYGCKVGRRPGRGFGALNDDGVAGKYGGDDGADEVMKWVTTKLLVEAL
jgi:hypothetical protein